MNQKFPKHSEAKFVLKAKDKKTSYYPSIVYLTCTLHTSGKEKYCYKK